MTDILEVVKALKELKEEQAAVETNLRELLGAIQDVLGDAAPAGNPPDASDDDPDKPPKFAKVDYYDLPDKGIPEPLGPAPPPTRTETPRPVIDEIEAPIVPLDQGDEDVI